MIQYCYTLVLTQNKVTQIILYLSEAQLILSKKLKQPSEQKSELLEKEVLLDFNKVSRIYSSLNVCVCVSLCFA